LWFLPEDWVYGGWPRSGEIDLMEARGNRNYWIGSTQIGVEQVATTLHFGPQWNVNGFNTAHRTRNWAPGFQREFHKYAMIWTPEKIEFIIDDIHHDTIWVGSGFWDRGNFWWSGLANPWAGASKAAPFDKEFHMLINTAIGGDFFPEDAGNGNGRKPWSQNSANPMLDFWNGRNQWLPSWKMNTDESHFLVDYVRVWAL
jgi:beta-glucanase (GH16 family)